MSSSRSVHHHTPSHHPAPSYVTPPRAHPYNKENKPVNSGKLNSIIDCISSIIRAMNWRYRSSEGAVIEFTEDETKPLTDAFKQLKNVAGELRVSIQNLRPASIPILHTYYDATRDQGLAQFNSQLATLMARKDAMDPDDFLMEEATLKAKVSNYETTRISEKYLLEHIKLKLNMAEIRRESTRVATDAEHEFCMFLVDVYNHANAKAAKRSFSLTDEN